MMKSNGMLGATIAKSVMLSNGCVSANGSRVRYIVIVYLDSISDLSPSSIVVGSLLKNARLGSSFRAIASEMKFDAPVSMNAIVLV